MSEEQNTGREEASLTNFLAPGVVAEDLPELFPLLAARKLLSAFTALFHGSENAVMARLLVLREIGARGDAPQWSPGELKARFAYVDPIVNQRAKLTKKPGESASKFDHPRDVQSSGLLVCFNRNWELHAIRTRSGIPREKALSPFRPDCLWHLWFLDSPHPSRP